MYQIPEPRLSLEIARLLPGLDRNARADPWVVQACDVADLVCAEEHLIGRLRNRKCPPPSESDLTRSVMFLRNRGSHVVGAGGRLALVSASSRRVGVGGARTRFGCHVTVAGTRLRSLGALPVAPGGCDALVIKVLCGRPSSSACSCSSRDHGAGTGAVGDGEQLLAMKCDEACRGEERRKQNISGIFDNCSKRK